jgi:hypothetical protein
LLHQQSGGQHLYLSTIGLFFHGHTLLQNVVVSVIYFSFFKLKIEFKEKRKESHTNTYSLQTCKNINKQQNKLNEYEKRNGKRNTNTYQLQTSKKYNNKINKKKRSKKKK